MNRHGFLIFRTPLRIAVVTGKVDGVAKAKIIQAFIDIPIAIAHQIDGDGQIRCNAANGFRFCMQKIQRLMGHEPLPIQR